MAAVSLAAIAISDSRTARAEQFTFDADGGASATTGGTGVWDGMGVASPSALWRPASNPTSLVIWPNTAPPNPDEAIFGGTAGTVTLNEESVNINVNKITFQVPLYTIAAPGTGTAAINLSGTTPTINTATAAGGTIISANLTGTAGFTRTSNTVGNVDLQLAGDNSGLSGTVNLNAGRLFFNTPTAGSAAATWNIASGLTVLFNNTSSGNKSVQIGALSGASGSILRAGGTNAATITFIIGALNTDTTFAGNFNNGSATIVTAVQKIGTGTLALTGNGTGTGQVQLSDGTLAIGANSVFGGTGGALSSGPLGIGQVDLRGTSAAVIRAADATPRTIGNAIVFSNSTIFGSATTGDLTFTGAVNSGTGAKTWTVNNANTTFSGVISGASAVNANTKAGPGTLTLSNAANASSKAWVVNAGTLKLAPPSGNNNIAFATPITVAAGATLDVTGVAAGFILSSGQTLRGFGSVAGSLTVGSGSTISPGTSTGTLTTAAETWAGGGNYTWEINDATGTAGSPTAGWDMISMGSLTVTADGATPFTVKVTSLGATQAAGPADNFDNTVAKSWVIASTTGITGTVSAANFTIDATAFQNSLGGGVFGIGTAGNDVVLTFTPVPEPATASIAAIAAFGLLSRRRRPHSN